MYLHLADTIFVAEAAAVVSWTQKVLTANLSYFRLRRELFEEFQGLLNPTRNVAVVSMSDEAFLVIRYFLTARNEALDDNKRLSFDKAILQLRKDAKAALAAFVTPSVGIAGMLGFSQGGTSRG